MMDKEELNQSQWQEKLHDIASGMAYPPTPDLADNVYSRLADDLKDEQLITRRQSMRRFAWALVILILAIAVLLSVPKVRAAVFEFFQIGSIRMFPAEPMPTTQTLTIPRPITATPIPATSSGEASSVLNLAGETTIAAAERNLGAPLRMPTYPETLGLPDKVFVQDIAGPLIVLVWLEPGTVEQARLSLHVLHFNGLAFGAKFEVQSQERTRVNGEEAFWVRGQHFLKYINADGLVDMGKSRLVEGNVLIWTDNEFTYRLETDLPLAEAIRIAESLQ